MPRIVLPVTLAALIGCGCRSSPESPPVVSQVHVISVHVKDAATFDAVYLFLRDILELPRIYGEPSKPEDVGETHYAGFSAGNAYLEPCGPYQSDAPFGPDRPARFHGLTFRPATSIASAAAELERRKIPHSGILGDGSLPRFVYVKDALLTGPKQAVSIWEIQDEDDRANLRFVGKSLEEAGGGALGIQRIREVRIRCPDAASLAGWGNLLEPAGHESGLWCVGNGPALRFIPGEETRIDSLLVQVESLEEARAVLTRKGLAGESTPEGVEIDPGKAWGLRIILTDQ